MVQDKSCIGHQRALARRFKSCRLSRFFKRSGRVIVPLTVQEILDDEIARKLV